MPTYICRFEHGGTPYYFDFSTVVDAPVSCAMKLREYKRYYFDKYGSEGMRDLPGRLARADAKGTSSISDKDLRDTVSFNRAGPKEGHVGVKKLLAMVLADRARCGLPPAPSKGGTPS